MEISSGVLLLSLAPIVLFFAFRRKSKPFAAVACSVAALILIAIVLQKPWRPQGSIHIVTQSTFGGFPIAVVQRYNGDGLNTTFFVVKRNSKWSWYCIGNDDFYWRSASLRRNPNGTLSVRKLRQNVASFDPSGGKVFWVGTPQSSSYETSEILQ